jgi:DNA polymerase III alpha subunit (gram-positive type)
MTKPGNIFMSLDLEMNQTDTDNKIIQIGAVIGNIESGLVLDKLSIIVNPGETVTSYITKLTGITDQQCRNGVYLPDAYARLIRFKDQYGAFINPIVFGGGDTECLKKQLAEYGPTEWHLGRRWIDVKTLYVAFQLANGKPVQGGLKNVCKKFGVNFQGPAHDALQDSLNTFNLFVAILKLLKKGTPDEKEAGSV